MSSNYNGATYPCGKCEQSPRNTVHTNPKQFGFHQWEPGWRDQADGFFDNPSNETPSEVV